MRDLTASESGLIRSIKERDLGAIRAYVRQQARELDRKPSLNRALDILEVIREKEPETFDRAAALWVARLVTERQVTVADVELAAKSMDSLFGIGRDVLDELVARPVSAAEAAKPRPGVTKIDSPAT
ncbi:MAG TPA: hypothetical protein VGF45_02340 [Polyangia bacterium]